MTIGGGHDMLMSGFPALPATYRNLERIEEAEQTDDFTGNVMRIAAYEPLISMSCPPPMVI